MSQPEPAGPVGRPATNRKAVYSLLCGVVAFGCIYVTPFLGLMVAVPAVTSGVHARREIADALGTQGGDSIAVIGLMIAGGAIVTVVLSWLLQLTS